MASNDSDQGEAPKFEGPARPTYTGADKIVLPAQEGISGKVLTVIQDVTNAEVQAAVDKLLNEITNTFSKVSAEITTKLTEMSNRLDQLEASVMADKPPKGGDPPNPA